MFELLGLQAHSLLTIQYESYINIILNSFSRTIGRFMIKLFKMGLIGLIIDRIFV